MWSLRSRSTGTALRSSHDRPSVQSHSTSLNAQLVHTSLTQSLNLTLCVCARATLHQLCLTP